jgi:hypothetical protein
MKKAGLPLVPKFEDVCRITARVRCQSKGITKADAAERSNGRIGAQGYQFTFTIEFALPKNTTPYNIAPINGTSVNIMENNANYKCLL